jgi:hypothetical protein
MIDIEADTKAIESRLNKMYWKIQRLGHRYIGMEMSEWQQDDVNRKRPYTKRAVRSKQASTLFRPHSRYEMRVRRKLYRQAVRRAKKFGKKMALPVVPIRINRWSTRPILRAEMITRLRVRMHDMMRERLQW